MLNKKQVTNIKPHVRGRQTSSNELVITWSDADLKKMFESFVKFIDASPNTVRTYRISLRQWFNYLHVKVIKQPTMDTVLDYRDALRASDKKPTTVDNYLMAVKQFFKWTEARGIYPDIAKNVKGVKTGEGFKKDALTSKQAKKLLAVIDRTTFIGKRNYAMVLMMLTMGLRTIEVSRANIEDIRNTGESTVLYVQGKGHIAKDAAVRIPEHVEAAVQEYLNVRNARSTSEPLFTSTSNRNENGRMATRSIRRNVKSLLRKAGLNSPRLTSHSLRHTAATLSLMHGAKPMEVQHLLRHKNLQTTEIYMHNIDAARNPAAEDVDKALFN